MKIVELSARMQALVDMVSMGSVVCDVGCDHGFVSIYMIQKGIAPKVYAMDVGIGPLDRAKEHIAQYQLEDFIETRLSDGLEKLRIGEADCMLCAGMGGPLMQRILTEGREKVHAMKELILQPQSEIQGFRRFLREEGYQIIRENMIYEEGKYYPMMKVVPSRVETSLAMDAEEQILWDTFGEFLLKEKNTVLEQYLQQSIAYMNTLLQQLKAQDGARALERAVELEKELCTLHRAVAYMKE